MVILAAMAVAAGALVPVSTAYAAETSITTGVVTPSKPVEGTKVTLKVTVDSAADVTGGEVTLQYNRIVQDRTTVDADGTATFRFVAQNAGKESVRVSFLGTGTAAPSTDLAYYTSKAAKSGGLSGLIRAAETLKPIVGAGVDAVPVAEGYGQAKTARVDKNGRYALRLKPGVYTVRAHRLQGGFLDSSISQITVKAGGSVRVNKKLNKSTAITGRVYDATGAAVSGVTVQAYDGAGMLKNELRTDAGGAYRFGRLDSSDWRIRVTDPTGRYVEKWFENGTDFATATTLSTNFGDKLTGRNVVLTAVAP
jgi:hypothetical protein